MAAAIGLRGVMAGLTVISKEIEEIAVIIVKVGRPAGPPHSSSPHQGAPNSVGGTSAAPFEPPVDKWGEARRDKKRTTAAKPSEAETQQQALAKKAAAKQKRDHFSTRSILNQIDGVEETDAPAPVVAAKKRTVYTPQSGNRKRDLKRRKDLKKTQITTPKASLRIVKMGHEITVGDLARQLSVKAGEQSKAYGRRSDGYD